MLASIPIATSSSWRSLLRCLRRLAAHGTTFLTSRIRFLGISKAVYWEPPLYGSMEPHFCSRMVTGWACAHEGQVYRAPRDFSTSHLGGRSKIGEHTKRSHYLLLH